MTQSLELLSKSQAIFHWFLPDSTLYPFWSPCITPIIVRSCYFAPSSRVVLQSPGFPYPIWNLSLSSLSCHCHKLWRKKRQKLYIKIARWWAILCSLTEKFDLDKHENFDRKFNFELELILLKLFEYFWGHRDNLLFPSPPPEQFHGILLCVFYILTFSYFPAVWKTFAECAIKEKNSIKFIQTQWIFHQQPQHLKAFILPFHP